MILISVSCVGAADFNQTDNGDFDDLNNEIAITSQNQTLNLDKDYHLTNSSQKHIIIDKSITIDGNDHSIDAPDVSRVFWVKADNVCIKNINFINSNSGGLAGGVISWWGNNGTLENCNFTDNVASSAGGAVLWRGDNGFISNCNFINNTVKTAADVSLTDGDGYDPTQPHIMTVNSDGGAMYLCGNNMSVDNCIFMNNSADFSGGAITICWGNNISVSNSKFKNNRAGHSGGAISWNGENGLLNSSKFIENSQNDLFLNSKNIALTDCHIANESLIESFYDVDYSNVKFGPLNSFDDLSLLINCTPEGGILVLDDDYRFISGSNKGIVISKAITIDGAGHILDGNRSSRIFNITADNVVIKNINFINGDAVGSYITNDYGGGALYWNGSNGFVENCNFTDNSDYTVENYGDEITNEEGVTIVVPRPIPVGAKTSEGGAILWIGLNGTVKNCSFRNNKVGYANHGGAVCWKGDCGKIINSEFYDNSAWVGAAIYWKGNHGELLSSNVFLIFPDDYRDVFKNSMLHWAGNNSTIKDSVLINAEIYGSNVTCDYNFWGDTLDNPNIIEKPDNVNNWILLNLTIDKPTVKKGDEVTVTWNLSNLIDKNGKISGYGPLNYSYEAKFIANDTGIVNVSYLYNQMEFEVVPFEYLDFTILAQKINETPEGGILVLDRNYMYINGTNKGILISKPITIDGNGHTLNGNHLSRMFNITSDNVTIKNMNFIKGNAYGRYFSNDAGGGAIYWNGANGYIENCNFTGNAGSGIEDDPFDKEETWTDDEGHVFQTIRFRPMGAKINEGGAIVWNGTNGTVFKCIFRNNGVGYPNSGGAICWRGDLGKVLESDFYNNEAWSGASIAWVGDNGTILHSKFINDGSIFGRDIMWFGENGTIKYSLLISSDGKSPLYAYSGNVIADYNFWGDILPDTKVDKIDNLNTWIVLNATCNTGFVTKGDTIIVSCDTLLIDKDGSVSNFTGLNIPGNLTLKADRDGFVKVTFENGKLNVKIIPKTKIVSRNLIKYYKQSKQFKARLYGADGKPAIGKYVRFTMAKKTYKVKTDKKGYATLNINNKPGKYTVIAQFANVKVKNIITVKTTLITKSISKKVKKSAKFTVKVLNSKGKAAANKIVKIKFKGKIYKIKTNKKGIAIFKLPNNLKVGKYSIKTACNGLTNSNRIIVRR